MKNFTVIGKWWNGSSIDLVNIEDEGVFALNGWSGEKYTTCWKVDEKDLTEASKEEYTITPGYTEIAEDEFEVTAYYVEANI